MEDPAFRSFEPQRRAILAGIASELLDELARQVEELQRADDAAVLAARAQQLATARAAVAGVASRRSAELDAKDCAALGVALRALKGERRLDG